MNFDIAFEMLIGHEGGYSRDRNDPGNWTGGRAGRGSLKGTKYGISAATFPYEDIENLTLLEAKLIYKNSYWDAVLCENLPETIRFDMFDLTVNSGAFTAAILLQRALQVKEDGVIGLKTLDAAYKINSQVLDKRLSAIRLLYLCSLKTFPHFGKGWVRRVAVNLLND